MKILVPKNTFLRVEDKFAVDFIDNDKEVPTNPTLLYKNLFKHGASTGRATVPQKFLAEQCKYSVRTLQTALCCLIALGYIHVEATPGGCNTYVLLYSERVKQLLQQYCYDILEDTSWYPRDVQSSSAERAPAASSAAASPMPGSDSPDAQPPQKMRGGCARSAYPSYNVYKNNKNNTPPAPPPSQPLGNGNGTPSATRGRGGFIAPSAKPALVHQAFERLWAVWPIQQARHGALRVFCALARAGRLPALDSLLETVERLRTHDDRWQRGYVPHLANWLRDERWTDAPVTRAGHSTPSLQPSSPCGAQASAASSAARMDSMRENTPPLTLPELPPALDADVHALCALWPTASRSPVRAFFRVMLASGKMPDMGAVLGAARQHLAESFTPRPLFSWLREEFRGCTA